MRRGPPLGIAPVDCSAQSALLGEEVRPIPFLDGYYISETGRVFRSTLARGFRERQPWMQPNGRRTALFQGPWGQKAIYVARLVCLVFNGSPPDDERLWVCHRDDDPTNNRPENLYWGTAKDNNEDCLRNGKRTDGLTNETALAAIEAARNGSTVTELAERFGVFPATIERLLRGETWRHLDGERVVRKREIVTQKILALAAEGMSVREIAKLVPMASQNIHEVLSRARRQGRLPRRNAAA